MPPPYVFDNEHHDALSQVAISDNEQVIVGNDSQLSISKGSCQETPDPGPSLPEISHPVARPKPFKKWKFWARTPGPADEQPEIVQYRLRSCDSKSTVSRGEKRPLPAPSGLQNLQAWK
ncbi:hypothetical protein PM082_007846 [Marasmius tenuissimus]|nr:hypothetical protein PM082_007846 [Marasmius tenuissimus]